MSKIAYQGTTGAYSNAICIKSHPEHEAIGFNSFQDCFNALSNKEVDIAMIPVRNSITGRVSESHIILPKLEGLEIVKEIKFAINHCLLGNKDSSLESIQRVYSHPQALMQCKKHIEDIAASPKTFSDTAEAAQYIKGKGNNEAASVSSEICAELYDLKILAKNFQDKAGNATTFFVFKRKNGNTPEFDNTKSYTSSIILTTKEGHSQLYKALGAFANHNINLTNIENFTGGQYAKFFLSFEGHINEENCKKCLEDLKELSQEIKILGSYETIEI
ncbi:MAG: prephenate dehydratase [Alphaproteobacteria bacterium]|jgi:prephenate dehydratase|nr:prephenate dehydratase [Alphaproteobacteria bacterium]